MISDLIIIAAILLLTLLGGKRGFAASVLNAVGIVVTGFLTYYISGFLSSWAYTAFIKQALIDNLQQLIASQGIDAAVNNCFAALPDWANGLVTFMLGLMGTSSGDITSNFNISSAVTNASSSAALSIESLAEPVVSSVLRLIIGAVISVVIFIIIKLIIRKLLFVFKIPVIKQINRILGGVLGFCEGCVIVYIFVNVYSAVLYYADPTLLQGSAASGALFGLFSTFV